MDTDFEAKTCPEAFLQQEKTGCEIFYSPSWTRPTTPAQGLLFLMCCGRFVQWRMTVLMPNDQVQP